MRNVPTDLLRAFVTVAETQNFTRAGEVLFRTQAAVSMQIRRLEEQLGTALFERDSRGTSLTDQGKFLLSYAKRILQLNLQLNDELLESLELGRATQLIRFGAPDDYATVLLPKVLRIFSETFPAVQVEIVCAASVDLLQEMKQLPDRAGSEKAQPGRWRSTARRGRDPSTFRAGRSQGGSDTRRIRLAGDSAEPRCQQTHERSGAELRPVEVYNDIRAKADPH